jgi:hypothetical protein
MANQLMKRRHSYLPPIAGINLVVQDFLMFVIPDKKSLRDQ